MPAITLPPTPPTITDPENFATRADAFNLWLSDTFVPELNTIIGTTIPAGSAAAGTLTGDTIAANVLNSSLQNLGTQNEILAMGGFKVSGLAAASANGDAVRYEQWADLFYNQITSSIGSITGTNFASATTIISGSSTTYDGGEYWFEFFSPSCVVSLAGELITFVLNDGGSDAGKFGQLTSTSGSSGTGVFFKRKITPSAAAHTYSVAAFVSSNTGTVVAGSGAANTQPPAYLRIRKV